ncbi:p48 polypeptide of DNA primase, partial [Spiromyces aspiralis]
RSLEIAHEYFEEIVLNDQRVLDSKHTWDNVLKLIPDEGIRDKLDSMWQSKGSVSAIKKWEELEDALERKARHLVVIGSRDRGGRYLGTIVSEIVLQYLYPRLDENVTTHLNHLLKSPFCVHPKTGRVCTPIAPNQFESFDPFKVPTVPDLLNEINIYDQDAIEVGTGESQDMKVEEGKTGGGGARIPNYKKTSLRPYIETFEEFVKRLERNKVVKDPLSF